MHENVDGSHFSVCITKHLDVVTLQSIIQTQKITVEKEKSTARLRFKVNLNVVTLFVA